MAQTPIKRNFLTVSQAARYFKVAERTIEDWIATDKLHAEPLDPDRARTPPIIPITEVERFEKERESK